MPNRLPAGPAGEDHTELTVVCSYFWLTLEVAELQMVFDVGEVANVVLLQIAVVVRHLFQQRCGILSVRSHPLAAAGTCDSMKKSYF